MISIALDYDGTITKDRALWMAFYFLCRAAGHDVRVVTMRYEHEPICDWPGIIYYTGRKAKKAWCDKNGIKIDIWIDDNPEWITNDSF